MALTEDQIERYSRHILLPEVGGKGQKRIAAAKVLITQMIGRTPLAKRVAPS